MEKGVPINDVRWDGDRPMHPEIEGLALEEYTAKMSKSLGNVVNPDEIIEQYGADVMRLYEMFMGPFEASCPWNTRDIEGVNRFLNRSWRLFDAERRAKDGAEDTLQKTRHKTIKKVTSDLETMGFNTAIAQLMTFVNEMTKLTTSHVEDLRALALMVSPFAPHFAEEVWAEGLGQTQSVFLQAWPEYDEALCQDAMVTLVVQVNGKKRGTCEVPADVGQDEALAAARQMADKYVVGKQVVKEIYVARNKLVNLVVRG